MADPEKLPGLSRCPGGTFDPQAPRSEAPYLLTIPPEIRYMIYRHCELSILFPPRSYLKLKAVKRHYYKFIPEYHTLSRVCRFLRSEILACIFSGNTFGMSLDTLDSIEDLNHKETLASLLRNVRHARLYSGFEAGFDGPHLWNDAGARPGMLVSQWMPQLEDLVVCPPAPDSHRDAGFVQFIRDVLRAPSTLKSLTFSDTFFTAEEEDFEFAKNLTPCSSKVETNYVPMVRKKQKEKHPGRQIPSKAARRDVNDVYCNIMGIGFKVKPCGPSKTSLSSTELGVIFSHTASFATQ